MARSGGLKERQHTYLQPDSLIHGGDLMRRGKVARLDILGGRHLSLMLHLHHGGRWMMVCHRRVEAEGCAQEKRLVNAGAEWPTANMSGVVDPRARDRRQVSAAALAEDSGRKKPG